MTASGIILWLSLKKGILEQKLQELQKLELELAHTKGLWEREQGEIINARKKVISLENENAILKAQLSTQRAESKDAHNYQSLITEKDKEISKLREEIQQLEKRFFSLIRRKG